MNETPRPSEDEAAIDAGIDAALDNAQPCQHDLAGCVSNAIDLISREFDVAGLRTSSTQVGDVTAIAVLLDHPASGGDPAYTQGAVVSLNPTGKPPIAGSSNGRPVLIPQDDAFIVQPVAQTPRGIEQIGETVTTGDLMGALLAAIGLNVPTPEPVKVTPPSPEPLQSINEIANQVQKHITGIAKPRVQRFHDRVVAACQSMEDLQSASISTKFCGEVGFGSREEPGPRIVDFDAESAIVSKFGTVTISASEIPEGDRGFHTADELARPIRTTLYPRVIQARLRHSEARQAAALLTLTAVLIKVGPVAIDQNLRRQAAQFYPEACEVPTAEVGEITLRATKLPA